MPSSAEKVVLAFCFIFGILCSSCTGYYVASPKNIGEKLERFNMGVLNLSYEDETTDRSSWVSLLDVFKSWQSEEVPEGWREDILKSLKLDTVGLRNLKDGFKADNDLRQVIRFIKNKCLKFLRTSLWSSNAKEDFRLSKNWCTRKSKFLRKTNKSR